MTVQEVLQRVETCNRMTNLSLFSPFNSSRVRTANLGQDSAQSLPLRPRDCHVYVHLLIKYCTVVHFIFHRGDSEANEKKKRINKQRQ